MKKVLLVLALVATYGVSMAISGTNVVTVDDAQVTIVADMNDNNVVSPEGEEENKKAVAKETTKAKGEGCSTAKAKGEGCADSKAEAKSEGCSGAKAEAKSGCGSSCGGTAKK